MENRINTRKSILKRAVAVVFFALFNFTFFISGCGGEQAKTPPIPTQTAPQETEVWENVGMESKTYGSLLLVSKANGLDSGFEPLELVPASCEGVYSVNKSGMELNASAKAALVSFCKKAKENGVRGYIVVSCYRSISYQQGLYDKKINDMKKIYDDEQEAVEAAGRIVVPPGTSEHHTGLAIDITCAEGEDENGDILSEELVKTEQGKWLAEHAHESGFIIRYPKDKTHITGVDYEPWHIRYVGLPHSVIMYEKNFCLEEYLDFLKQQSVFDFTYDGKQYTIAYFDDAIAASAPVGCEYSTSPDGRGGVIVTINR